MIFHATESYYLRIKDIDKRRADSKNEYTHARQIRGDTKNTNIYTATHLSKLAHTDFQMEDSIMYILQ